MKATRSDPKQQLLQDVLQGEAGLDSNPARQRALAAFRAAHSQRRLFAILRLAAVMVALLAGAFFLRIQGRKQPSVGPAETQTPLKASPVMASTSLPKLTDEELLKSFPPNTCYLAEVDGRTILVFTESATRKKYLR